MDGKPVEYVGQLQQRIAFRTPGETVKVEVARKGGVRKTYEVKLQAMPGATAVADRSAGDTGETSDAGAAMGRLGVTVAPVTQEDVARFQLTPAQRGLVVTDVTAGGPSWGELVDMRPWRPRHHPRGRGQAGEDPPPSWPSGSRG